MHTDKHSRYSCAHMLKCIHLRIYMCKCTNNVCSYIYVYKYICICLYVHIYALFLYVCVCVSCVCLCVCVSVSQGGLCRVDDGEKALMNPAYVNSSYRNTSMGIFDYWIGSNILTTAIGRLGIQDHNNKKANPILTYDRMVYMCMHVCLCVRVCIRAGDMSECKRALTK